MAPLKSSIMMIFIIMNIAHADVNEDLKNCLRQLRYAFEYTRDSAASCIRHSIRNYIKGQRIPVPAYILLDENKNIFMPDNEELVKDGTQNDSEAVFDKWLAEELKRHTSSEFGDDNEGQQDVESSSSFGFGSSQYGFGSSENDSNSKEEFVNWSEINNWIIDEGQQSIDSSSQTVPAQQGYPLSKNYAELYHEELENMLTGRSLLNRAKFCQKFFNVKKFACLEALKIFGEHATTAVKVAFNDYTLDECLRLKSTDPKYNYIYCYISYLSGKCESTFSTKPSTFCQEKMKAKYNLEELPELPKILW